MKVEIIKMEIEKEKALISFDTEVIDDDNFNPFISQERKDQYRRRCIKVEYNCFDGTDVYYLTRTIKSLEKNFNLKPCKNLIEGAKAIEKQNLLYDSKDRFVPEIFWNKDTSKWYFRF